MKSRRFRHWSSGSSRGLVISAARFRAVAGSLTHPTRPRSPGDQRVAVMSTPFTFARHRRFKRLRSERGVSLIHVALLLLVMMGFSMFVTDYGVLWLARGQAQNAADAGAVAAAISLAFDNATDFSTTGPAYNAGTNAATTNLVFGTAPT